MSISIEKKKRVFFPAEFNAENWPELEKALGEMLAAPVASTTELIALIEKSGELSDILEEVGAWKSIRMTQHADDPELSRLQTQFYEQVIAPAQPLFFQFEKKIHENEYFSQLPADRYTQLGKILKNDIELYREENILLSVKENELVNRYGEIYSKLTVQFEGEEKTLKEMDLVQRDTDRSRREAAWRLVMEKMLEKKDEFEGLFDELKDLRVRIARNAGFDNYRDYMHQALGRFDYTPQDVEKFQQAIETAAVPIMRRINEERRRKLGVESLRPWDLLVDVDGRMLKPFATTKELLAGSLRILQRVDPEFAAIIGGMDEQGFLDLDNRKGKAPGGYCSSLRESGSTFIFMNAVGIQYDVETLLHESGHAIHAFEKKDEKIAEYKNTPSEVAELASTSMEYLTAEFYDEFYADPEDLRKAKGELLERAISLFPTVAIVDAFQHMAYLHSEYSADERDRQYSLIRERFNTGVDWSGLSRENEIGWLKTLHIFEIPFYYVEYAISGLGAIAVYKQFKTNPAKAIENYKAFMKLGYSRSVPEIYAAAGIKFDFSKEYLQEMIGFIEGELRCLEK
jgi:oligoendopeptidase F